ncbi:MAG: hypothetical protein WC998_00705 [Candidatus Paceibacterota bacterium]|jgi:hypothetical protein
MAGSYKTIEVGIKIPTRVLQANMGTMWEFLFSHLKKMWDKKFSNHPDALGKNRTITITFKSEYIKKEFRDDQD